MLTYIEDLYTIHDNIPDPILADIKCGICLGDFILVTLKNFVFEIRTIGPWLVIEPMDNFAQSNQGLKHAQPASTQIY